MYEETIAKHFEVKEQRKLSYSEEASGPFLGISKM
jgi:hypothetical protein